MSAYRLHPALPLGQFVLGLPAVWFGQGLGETAWSGLGLIGKALSDRAFVGMASATMAPACSVPALASWACPRLRAELATWAAACWVSSGQPKPELPK